MSRGIPFAPWREVWERRYLTVDSRRYAGRTPRPRWRWALFRASLWVAWRIRRGWATRLAGWFCIVRWLGFDGDWSSWPVEWPKWMKRKEEVPF